MLARPYQREDARGCDRLLVGSTIADPARDTILVVGHLGEPEALLCYRETAFIHEFVCGEDFRARLRADALANFAISHARHKGIRSAVFLVDQKNLKMQKWAVSIGAIEQTDPGDKLYLLNTP